MIFDDLTPTLAMQLEMALDAREPELRDALRSGALLSIDELRCVDAAVVAHSKAALGELGEVTPDSELLRSTVKFLRSWIPECETEPERWGRWLVDDDAPVDPWVTRKRRQESEQDGVDEQPIPWNPELSPTDDLRRLVPGLGEALRDVLAQDEPTILEIIEGEGGLDPLQISRVGKALAGAHVGAMTADWQPTEKSEFLRTLLWAFNRLIPSRSRELPGWGTYRHPGRDPVDDSGSGVAD